MKISKGKLKNRTFNVPKNIRPVSLRVKKSLFDILGNDLDGKVVLDLFSGSGALALESLSLGARSAVLTDNNRETVKVIRGNLEIMGLKEQAIVLLRDGIKIIPVFFKQKRKFDLIFLDPPYYKGLAIKALHTLDEYDILSPHGLIAITCYNKDISSDVYRNFRQVFFRVYGQTVLALYEKNHE